MFGVTEEKKALSEAYRMMMLLPAWRDLEHYAETEVESSVKRVDNKSASDLTLGYVCEERGVRKGIRKLIQHAEQKRDGV